MSEPVIVLTTVPSAEVGERLGRALIDRTLAACVNVLPPMTSLYRWKGAVQRDVECQLVIKTDQSRVDAVREVVRECHPYELPEFLVVAVDRGDPAYLAWVAAGSGVAAPVPE